MGVFGRSIGPLIGLARPTPARLFYDLGDLSDAIMKTLGVFLEAKNRTHTDRSLDPD